MHLVGRLAETEPAMKPVIERIGGIASDRDELWQQMLRRQVTEREYWAQRAEEFGAAVGETWDTRAMMHRLYELPRHYWLRAEMVDLMTEVKAAGLRLGALTNDMTAFHGPGWVEQQEHLKLFDVIVDASLTGVMKPDPRAFRAGRRGARPARGADRVPRRHAVERRGRPRGGHGGRPGARGTTPGPPSTPPGTCSGSALAQVN